MCVAGKLHVFKDINHIDFYEINYVQNKIGMAHACAPNTSRADTGPQL